jgi:class 3 adenylate cyclase/alpha-beta hydrolase superfamily lysophospholipase
VSQFPPETHYVDVGGAQVAYQVVGEGAFDLVATLGLGSNIELVWEVGPAAALNRSLASISRFILFDRRGMGVSDPIGRDAPPTWEDWAEDVRAVLDAVGSKRAAVLAGQDAGPMGILFAAMHPDRVSHLVLHNTAARVLKDDDYPFGASPADLDALTSLVEQWWGTPEFVRTVMPGLADDEEFVRVLARNLRASVSPRRAAAQFDYTNRQLDVRETLPLIHAPTLVIHSTDNPVAPIEHGRYLAEHIPGAKLIELSGGDTLPFSELFDEVAEFLTGERPVVPIDRILATVLFTDIVGSTAHAASLGDQRWRSTLDAHDRAVREQLRRFRGTEINTTGDGFVATFDGPARAIRCSHAIVEATHDLGIDVRIGLHTGECEVRGDDLGGLAVHIAARVAAAAGGDEVLVSSTVKDLVAGSGITFDDRGEHDLKGVPGTWRLYAAQR